MKRCIVLVFAFLVVFVQPASAGPLEEGWKLAKQGDGVVVYTKPVPGTNLKEFLGITDVSAPLEVTAEVFKDYSSFPGWYGFCRDIRLVKEINRDRKILYYVLATPWPATDRDVVVDVVVDENRAQGRTVISINALREELVPVQSTYVRMTHLVGRCTMTRASGNTTHVVYTVNSDPAGNLPLKLVNILAKDQPYITLKNLRDMVKKDVYYEKAGLKKK